MPHIGLLLRLIERESVDDNWEAVLRLLDRLDPLADPKDRDAAEFSLYHRGYALLELNRHQEAAESLGRLVECDGHSAHYRLLHADALIRAREWDEAVRQLEAGLACEPDHPGCLCALGWTRYQTGEQDAGRALLEHTLEVHPHYFPAHLDLGLILAAEGRWAESEAHLRSALAGAPEDVEIQEVLEAVLDSRARAEQERRRVRRLWPALRERRLALPATQARRLRELRRHLRERGASHLEILLAETLWFDFTALTAEPPPLDAAWAAAVGYAIHRLNERPIRRADVAGEWRVGESTLGRRFRLLRDALGLAHRDPRYSAEALVDPPDEPDDVPEGPLPAGALIPVDFVARRRLPGESPCPCGSGHPAASCRHRRRD